MQRPSFNKRKKVLAAALAIALFPPAAPAVSLSPDGLGQALIYPYYTVRSAGGNAFHTYLSVGNSTSESKALRVRIREGRNGRPALDLNLYLGPNDLWTGALAPTAEGAQLLTADTSCTDPPFANGAIALRRDAFSGAQSDGFGDSLDRTREGYVEILEMATLTGDSRNAVSHNSGGVPNNCAAIRGSATPSVAPPRGGLWGTVTLINVNGGQDFTLDATALADLASRPYFRPPSDPYPDFAATEIDPVSVVLKRGTDLSQPLAIPGRFDNANLLYRSTWSRPVDAVSAVLMSAAWIAEYSLDAATASATDLVVTTPTRHHYVTAQGATAPFSAASGWSFTCIKPEGTVWGESIRRLAFDRESRDVHAEGCGDFFPVPCPQNNAAICATTAVASMVNRTRVAPENGSSTVFGSTTGGLARGDWRLFAGISGGWVYAVPATQAATSVGLASLPDSVRVNLDTGQAVTGRHTFFGLPAVGFFARTFDNGQLSCAGASCQGIYGSAFPMRHQRVLAP